MKLQLFCAALTVAGLMAGDARANLIVNGGFETGDFTGWTLGGNTSPMSVVTSPVDGGSFSAKIAGGSRRSDTLSQTISDTAGTVYDLSFARFQGGGGRAIGLTVTWDGTVIFSEMNPGSDPFQDFNFTVVGTGSDTLVFTAFNMPSSSYLDNVDLEAVTPEPGLYAALGLGLSGLAVFRRRQK